MSNNEAITSNPKTLTPFGQPSTMPAMSQLTWYVAHTRPRREKKLKEYCDEKKFAALLPCFSSARKYRRKTVVFLKPLFPGYLFVQILPSQTQSLAQNEHVARVLTVFDQDLFAQQLEDILKALETGLEIRVAPEIGAGHRVKIKQGPLQGMEAWVEDRQGMTIVLLRLDFIGQAAAVKVPADYLELV
jgi:transcription antitermination factor NusG